MFILTPKTVSKLFKYVNVNSNSNGEKFELKQQPLMLNTLGQFVPRRSKQSGYCGLINGDLEPNNGRMIIMSIGFNLPPPHQLLGHFQTDMKKDIILPHAE